MSKMINCKTCSQEIASSAKSCPNCGAKNKKPFYKRSWFFVLVFFIIIGIIGGSEDDSTTTDTGTNKTEQVSTTTNTNKEEPKKVETTKEKEVDPLENEKILESIILTTLETSYPKGEVKIQEDEGLKMYSVYPFDGFVAGVTLMAATDSFTDDYYKIIENFEKTSKIIMDQAREYGVKKKYALAIQNDQNTDNVLMTFYDGKTITNSFEKNK